MNFYFAYGSNMDKNQMMMRCPGARMLGAAILYDHELKFTIFSPKRQSGCADIVARNGSEVYGLLYELDDKDLDALDSYEGVPMHYKRIEVTVESKIEKSTRIVNAYAYEVVAKSTGLRPSPEYLKLLLDAAILYNFPSEYLTKLKNTVQ